MTVTAEHLTRTYQRTESESDPAVCVAENKQHDFLVVIPKGTVREVNLCVGCGHMEPTGLRIVR